MSSRPPSAQRGRWATTTGSRIRAGLGAGPGSRCGVSVTRGTASARCRRGHGKRDHSRRRGGRAGSGGRPHARELRGWPARSTRSRGVDLDWVEADAEALPFGDDEFDVVTSSFGAIFAPDHQAGRRSAPACVQAWRDDRHAELHTRGLGRRLLRSLSRSYTPAPPSGCALRRPSWGSEPHVRELFGDRVSELAKLTREDVRGAQPRRPRRAYCEFFK